MRRPVFDCGRSSRWQVPPAVPQTCARRPKAREYGGLRGGAVAGILVGGRICRTAIRHPAWNAIARCWFERLQIFAADVGAPAWAAPERWREDALDVIATFKDRIYSLEIPIAVPSNATRACVSTTTPQSGPGVRKASIRPAYRGWDRTSDRAPVWIEIKPPSFEVRPTPAVSPFARAPARFDVPRAVH